MSENSRRPSRGPMGRGRMNGEKAKDFSGAVKKLLRYMSKYKIRLIGIMIFAIVGTVFNIVGPKILGKATTELFNGLVAKVNGTGGIDFDKIGKILLWTLGKGDFYMANRKRDVQILLWVTPEEKKMIRKRMILSKTSNMSVYLRKMAIDGMIVNTDTTYLKAMYQEMHKIGVNINQLAKVANTVGTATPQDIEELKEMVKKIWLTLRSFQSNLQ